MAGNDFQENRNPAIFEVIILNPQKRNNLKGWVRIYEGVLMTQQRTFSPEFKIRVLLELISGEKGLMQASLEYGIKDKVLG